MKIHSHVKSRKNIYKKFRVDKKRSASVFKNPKTYKIKIHEGKEEGLPNKGRA